ncbi:MAG: CDP-diacylglycerol--glycerol-3-phosphate 3-phosphatidyltransferase [Ruminococcaceae bacterium]|nr:CDP-diacylglycerol--glycerol-3-phosphate 3-phosphatidyltransferase [Oscillospiraceae bacterium]
MNIPNKLTVLRMALVPVFMIVYMIEAIPYHTAIAAFIFILASLTDWLDGYLARKNNLVTNFGKFMDPLADKLLVTGALLCLMERGEVAYWVVMIIIAREFIVSGLRLVAVTKGIVIAAGQLGKLKTVLQLVAIIAAILSINKTIVDVLIYLCTLMTVISGMDYLIRNRKVFQEE